jgi:hypothetical protein
MDEFFEWKELHHRDPETEEPAEHDPVAASCGGFLWRLNPEPRQNTNYTTFGT